MSVSTHVLDTGKGSPAAGVAVRLERQTSAGWTLLAESRTDADGRCRDLTPNGLTLEAGVYRLHFETAPYFAAVGVASLYPFVEISFQVLDPALSLHLPLLLTANSYVTYRGS